MLAKERMSEMQRIRGVDPHEVDGRGIPFDLVQELLYKVEYADKYSIGIKLLLFTGCRISEFNRMYRENICENYIYWKCGKTQEGYRKEYLPDSFLKELEIYWKKTSMPSNQVFQCKGESFSVDFGKFVRPILSREWQEERMVLRMQRKTKKLKLVPEKKYMLKGFRKNFATLYFAYYWKKYNSPDVAVERVSKRMKHSSKKMTSSHYIETMEQIEAERYCHLMPFEVIKNAKQARILDYFE